jgi:hypothetical protein
MGTEIASKAEPRPHHIDEVMVCRMLALLRKRLGGAEIKPKLTLIQGGKEACHE